MRRESFVLISRVLVYQWICLVKLYKLMESIFSNFEFVFELLTENRKIFKLIEILCHKLLLKKSISSKDFAYSP